MNVLSIDKQTAIIAALVDGNSVRATARICGVAKGTVLSLLRIVGAHCKNHHDRFVCGVAAKRVQVDEIWSFVGAKQRNAKNAGQGDVWTFTAIDADTKLIIGYRLGARDGTTARPFLLDLADRLNGRCQLTTDGHKMYTWAVENAFGWNGADFAQLVKVFAPSAEGERRYSPPIIVSTQKMTVMGQPDPAHVSTSYVERSNLTMRMQMRRFTRLTNAFSKKIENHLYAVALHFMFYNYCRAHGTLTAAAGGIKTTPAMAAGLTNRVWTIHDLIDLLQGK